MLKLPSLATDDGRKFWAFLVILGGCIVMTLFAAVGVYLVSGNVVYSFYLAMAAHIQIFFGLGAFGWVLGRRLQTEVGKDGLKLSDGNGTSLTAEVKVEANKGG